MVPTCNHHTECQAVVEEFDGRSGFEESPGQAQLGQADQVAHKEDEHQLYTGQIHAEIRLII